MLPISYKGPYEGSLLKPLDYMTLGLAVRNRVHIDGIGEYSPNVTSIFKKQASF